jgi:hypothetical protein
VGLFRAAAPTTVGHCTWCGLGHFGSVVVLVFLVISSSSSFPSHHRTSHILVCSQVGCRPLVLAPLRLCSSLADWEDGYSFVLPSVPLVIVQSIEPTLDGVFFRPGGLLAPCRVVTQSYPWIPIVDSTDGLPMLLVHYHQPWCLLCEAGRRESFSSITPLGRLDRSWSFCWAVDRWLS